MEMANGQTPDEGAKSHENFLRRSFVYLILNGMKSAIELGFFGVTARLPGSGYSTFWALMKLFFIITAPLMAFQFVVTKEVASFGVLGEYGKRRYFLVQTLRYLFRFAAVIIVAGLLLSGVIARSLNIDSIIPVILLFVVIGFYFPIPALFGAVQGLKKFATFGLMEMSWGLFRLAFGVILVVVFSFGLPSLMVGVMAATIITTIYSYRSARSIFGYTGESIEKSEILHAYSLVIPVILTLFAITMMKNIDVVLAKGYFAPAEADAYTCASSVGSGFFILSAIFMVMFPLVSEEKTRGGNPIMFLYKSLGFVLVFSAIGILVTVLYPEIPMYVFTLGKIIPGALPLIRMVGFAVVPIAMVNIMANYFLAKHQWRFIPIVLGGMILQLILMFLLHPNPATMLCCVIAANTITLISMIVYLYYEHRMFLNGK